MKSTNETAGVSMSIVRGEADCPQNLLVAQHGIFFKIGSHEDRGNNERLRSDSRKTSFRVPKTQKSDLSRLDVLSPSTFRDRFHRCFMEALFLQHPSDWLIGI